VQQDAIGSFVLRVQRKVELRNSDFAENFADCVRSSHRSKVFGLKNSDSGRKSEEPQSDHGAQRKNSQASKTLRPQLAGR
jgi:hypothetical protein